MDRLRAGFVGAGREPDLHAIECLRSPRAELIPACDASSEIAQRQAACWGVSGKRAFSDDRDLLESDEFDLVEILLPHHVDAPVALNAVRAGKQVCLQEPMTLSPREAHAVIAAAHAAKAQLGVR